MTAISIWFVGIITATAWLRYTKRIEPRPAWILASFCVAALAGWVEG